MITANVHDARALGYCMVGTSEFYKAHGLDFRAFVREGTPVEQLQNTGDAMAIALADKAIARHG